MPNIFSQTLARLFAPRKNQLLKDYPPPCLICDVRQIGDVVSLWDPGVCDAFVMEWFRRIAAGRPTWQHRRRVVDGRKVTVLSPDPVNWNKKAPRLRQLQKSYEAFGRDRRFGYTVMPAIENPERQDQLYDTPFKLADAHEVATSIFSALAEARGRVNLGDEQLFFGLRLWLSSCTHMIGIHLRRNVAGSPAIAGNIDPEMLHLFDPNVGEFQIKNDVGCISFLRDLLSVYGDNITRVNLSHVKVWWGRGTSSTSPFRHEPEDDSDGFVVVDDLDHDDDFDHV
jgi:hypothetical protein